MDQEFVRKRISELRMQKGVSEYKMSLDLGHSKSYIQSISSGRALPSMPEFLYICDYFGITPQEFFDVGAKMPALVAELARRASGLKTEDVRALLYVAERFAEKEKRAT